MNELTTLAELGADLDPPDQRPPDRLRGRVMSAAAGGARAGRGGLLSRPRLTMPRLGWRLAAAGALAVAITAGLFAAQTTEIGGREPAAVASAEEILHNAALVAAEQPDQSPRGDQFVFVESIAANTTTTDGGPPSPLPPVLRQIWLSVDGTGDGLLRQRPRSGGAWDERVLDGCRDGKMAIREGPDGPIIGSERCEPHPARPTDLPTEADPMYDYLANYSDNKNPEAVRAFRAVGDILREGYVSPRSTAAMFQAAGRITGVTVVRDAVDAAGRPGVAVALTDQGIRSELIFDSETYAFLGERTVAAGTDVAEAGTVISAGARMRVVVVDRSGQLP